MNLDDVRRLSAADLALTLDDLGIELGWVIGGDIRSAALLDPTAPCLPAPASSRNQAFQNPVVPDTEVRPTSTFRAGR